MKNRLPILARFNRWANRRLYDCCAMLSEEDYREDRGAFFGSVHRTLNHLLVVDHNWMARISGEGELLPLNNVLHDEFDDLRHAREAKDVELIALVDSLPDDRLADDLRYKLMTGAEGTTPCDLVLLTVFNHQTHHRGQVHALLTRAGIKPPPLDIVVFLDEAPEVLADG